MSRKINVLVVYTDTMGGVGFFRSRQPHEQLMAQYPDEFNVKFAIMPDFNDLNLFSMYDIVHFHKGLFPNQEGFLNVLQYCKENKIKTIIDIDDYWTPNPHHPYYLISIHQKDDEQIRNSLQKCDYVTTTTELFANKIMPLNKNIKIFPNAINPDDECFKTEKKPCDKLRVGMIMGSTHEYDMATMDNFVSKLPKEILDKICFVLCGFDLRGTVSEINQKTGKITERDILPQETVWYSYEKMITDNYKIVSDNYRNYLHMFQQNIEYTDAVKEGYMRRWTLPMDKYYQHYNYVDVLLAPLEENDFNRVKSNLKMVECAFSHTAFIGSNFGPYTLDAKPALKRGGEIDPNGNCILIEKNRAHKDWAKTIEKLVKNPQLVKMLQDNLYKDYKDKYNLKTQTEIRKEFYEKIINE